MAENKTRHLPANAALATAKYVRMTPMKCRRVIDLVRGMPLDQALDVLRFDVHAASDPIYKVLHSAAANAENNKQPRPQPAVRQPGLRRRGPDAQALPPPRPGPCLPHPQAHEPHHDRRRDGSAGTTVPKTAKQKAGAR